MGYWQGVILLIVGLAISIALHELGHLIPAKIFGVYTPRYMLGFGPKLFSIKRGETEYGIAAIPLGGYVRMAGMYPPGRPDRKTHKANGTLTMAEEARQAAGEDLPKGMEHRAFYAISVPKKLTIMAGGILMNLLLSVFCTSIALGVIGVQTPTTVVGDVIACLPAEGVVSSSNTSLEKRTNNACPEASLPSPAAISGLEKGDKILSWNGQKVNSWEELYPLITEGYGQVIEVKILRKETLQKLKVQGLLYEKDGQRHQIVGLRTQTVRQAQSLSFVGSAIWQMASGTAKILMRLPQELLNTTINLFQPDTDRDRNGLVGIVGVGQIAGNITATQQQGYGLPEKVVSFLMLFASLNMTLFMFNLIPLLPLDGGQILGASWEGIRRKVRKLQGKEDLGAVDLARALPLTLTVIALLVLMTVLLVAIDIVKPL